MVRRWGVDKFSRREQAVYDATFAGVFAQNASNDIQWSLIETMAIEAAERAVKTHQEMVRGHVVLAKRRRPNA